MPINKSPVYNRYDLYQSVIGVQGRYLFVDAVLAKGYPPGAVQWTFPDMTYLDPGQSRGRFTVFRNGTLRISNVRYDDRGQYVTIARNRVGWDRAFSPFTIYGMYKSVAGGLSRKELRVFSSSQYYVT